MIVPVMARLMPVLHTIFAEHPDRYALDFPELKPGNMSKPAFFGRLIRVFSADREHCETLLDTIDRHPALSQAIMSGRIRMVPEDYHGPVVIVHRARIAPRSQPNNRRRDLDSQQSSQSPFIQMRSQSTGQHFSLLLKRDILPEQSIVGATQGVPNSYGLSGERPVFLPNLTA
ncbi:type I-F CRISPR-associated endoribonuclease Cas6/Csy4 [Acidithiobacillus montserratensis]|uniref:Type I-F CRISPR-associated endoribonuclease Cas6/Csy4 n=1 Tax=Acidithiobacillus montserratensis TaxID=2729135 RepID=A0ACD5HIE7_9PROT|nr:type I-F CRISPR-associated endoribonuclease Cas6/Csy4 [Acidithiobacillus montserratensis]MBU2746595.1 type I-F CRISPR-associated endoribonuclease Cas6/Csy4 [Acidithiobacillus montserratensis]